MEFANDQVQAMDAGPEATDREPSLNSILSAPTLIPLIARLTSYAATICDRNGGILWVNEAFARLTGWDSDEIIGLSPSQFLHGPATDPSTVRFMRQQIAVGQPFQCEVLNYRRDGTTFWISLEALPVEDELGGVDGYLTLQREISAQGHAETKLRQEHRLLKAVSDSLSLFIGSDDPRKAFVELLRGLLDLTESEFGFIQELDVEKGGPPKLRAWVHPGASRNERASDLIDPDWDEGLSIDPAKALVGENGDKLVTGETKESSTVAGGGRGGETSDWDSPLHTIPGLPVMKGDKLLGVVGLANGRHGHSLADAEFLKPLLTSIGLLMDAHARDQRRREMERSLRETEEWLEETGRVAKVGAWMLDADTMKLKWSSQTLRIHEVPPDFVPDLESAIAFYDEDARVLISNAVQQGLVDGLPWDLELPFTTAKGNPRWVRAIGHAAIEDGKVTRVFGTFQDITEQRLAEVEKEKLQARVLQSQKMESVGRLAGGIAHDFNNKLAVILGHSEMMLMDESLTSQQTAHLIAIQSAGQQSADLTHQLLTFARNQHAAPRRIDPNTTICKMLDLLRKSVGEEVQVEWMPDSEIGMVNIDPVQLDQILVSLCMNARDAISGTGRILISTRHEQSNEVRHLHSADLAVGDYVVLTVSDTGCGISQAALQHLFEPFNTTKPVGEGPGLGLATVYGIVQQIEGAIDVDSDPSIGTTFRIYLPRVSGTNSELSRDSEVSAGSSRIDQKEFVLLVEDEPALLRVGKLLLGKLGHTAYTARNAREALQVFQSHGGLISVVISDIVLPDLNGFELARRISRMQPKTRFVFISGYNADQGTSVWRAESPAPILMKPFNSEYLASGIQDAREL